MDERKKGYVTVGDGVVTIKEPGRSALIVANILGSTPGADGQPDRIWLDRIVHRVDVSLDGWEATGAISTILQRC